MRDESGQIRRFLNVYVNEEDIRFLGGASYAFQDGDEVLLVHESVLDWPCPGRNLKLKSLTDQPLVDPQNYDLILRWDARRQRFETMDR